MISNKQTKLITSLKQKKYRDKHGLFVAEGPKVISELIDEGLRPYLFFTTDELFVSNDKSLIINKLELKKISFLKTPNTSLAVFKIPKEVSLPKSGLIVVLDALRDPGNLGTIIRLCDWFGVEHLVCSPDTVDAYNPKVVQASMGSLARVKIHYTPLIDFLKNINLPIFGGFMDGKNIYQKTLPESAVLVVGNEANGISDKTASFISHPVSIPGYGKIQKTESLNVAAATAILLNEFRRSIEM